MIKSLCYAGIVCNVSEPMPHPNDDITLKLYQMPFTKGYTALKQLSQAKGLIQKMKADRVTHLYNPVMPALVGNGLAHQGLQTTLVIQ